MKRKIRATPFMVTRDDSGERDGWWVSHGGHWGPLFVDDKYLGRLTAALVVARDETARRKARRR